MRENWFDKLEFGGESPLTTRDCQSGNQLTLLPDSKEYLPYREIM